MTISLSRNYRLFALIAFAVLILIRPASANDKPVFDILFIGNSYTYSPDIPTIVETFINKDPNSPIRVNVDSSVQPGLHMRDQWERGEPLQKIRSKNWHYVILQNQSNWACFPQMRKDFMQYGRMFADEIRSAGGIPIIPETWPKEPNTKWYTDIPQIKNFEYMAARLSVHTPEVASHLNGELVPINYYWIKAMQKTRGIKLYRDGSHMSLAGAYLVTLVYYKFFTGQNYSNPKSILGGVSDAEAQVLQRVVSEHDYQSKN